MTPKLGRVLHSHQSLLCSDRLAAVRPQIRSGRGPRAAGETRTPREPRSASAVGALLAAGLSRERCCPFLSPEDVLGNAPRVTANSGRPCPWNAVFGFSCQLSFCKPSYTRSGISQGFTYKPLGLLRLCLELPAWGAPGTAPPSEIHPCLSARIPS